jgi:hypothetical protein
MESVLRLSVYGAGNGTDHSRPTAPFMPTLAFRLLNGTMHPTRLMIDRNDQVMRRFTNLSVSHKAFGLNATSEWRSIKCF